MELQGKTAIVTGSARGIGEGIAMVFAREGANVVVNSRKPADCAVVVDKIKAMGGKAIAVGADVSKKGDVTAMVEETVKQFGGVDAYPLPCRRFGDVAEAWCHIDALHALAIPYNLVYTGDGLYVLARAPQGSRTLASWNCGFAWSELAGAITVFSRDEFDRLSETEIAAELAKLAP